MPAWTRGGSFHSSRRTFSQAWLPQKGGVCTFTGSDTCARQHVIQAPLDLALVDIRATQRSVVPAQVFPAVNAAREGS